ncbi:hypothetical protein CMO89_01030 [Candidatus Woesearchaeota archaeon]|nr:hypothetical protein [Candidatus Woesearchaeota archaeon]|tara:strand:+ start:21543 stop:21980 length:438 start_codon:yes stop_codon:yes gene_type:complete
MAIFLNNKKASAAIVMLSTFLIVVVVFVAMSYLSRECNTDADCGEGFYCGSDFKCHEIKVMEKVVVKNELMGPSLIIMIGIVSASVIFNIDKIKGLELNKKIPEMMRKLKEFFENKFFRKEDFPERKLKDNYTDIANPKEFGEYK